MHIQVTNEFTGFIVGRSDDEEGEYLGEVLQRHATCLTVRRQLQKMFEEEREVSHVGFGKDVPVVCYHFARRVAC